MKQFIFFIQFNVYIYLILDDKKHVLQLYKAACVEYTRKNISLE